MDGTRIGELPFGSVPTRDAAHGDGVSVSPGPVRRS